MQDTGRTANTQYFYRVVATNSGGSTNGTIASATTLNNPPATAAAPTLSVVSSTVIDVTMPPLPARADSQVLQRSTDSITFVNI